jgi:hypothetical protein
MDIYFPLKEFIYRGLHEGRSFLLCCFYKLDRRKIIRAAMGWSGKDDISCGA